MPIDIQTYEAEQVTRANDTGRQPVVFVHGLWLLPSSWDRWATFFEEAGAVALTPGWPDDPVTPAEANAHPETMAGKSIGQVADHFAQIVARLERKPVVIGHSFGGLLAEILAGRGLCAATVAISPAPARGVLPLPFSALKSAWPVLHDPANRKRAIPLTFDQFRFAFANAVDDDEAQGLYDTFAVPASGAPLFQSAAANLNPWTEAKIEPCAERGPLLVIGSDGDHTVPWVVAEAAFELERRQGGITERLLLSGRGHSLTIDHGWKDVARAALAFVSRFVPTSANVVVP